MHFLSILSTCLLLNAASALSGNGCALLKAKFPTDVAFAGSAKYTALNTAWSLNSILHPPCIFSPTSTSTIAKAIKTLAKANAEFSIRSGGHSFIPGWSTTSSGVAIHLTPLNAITLSTDKKTVKIGTGARWGEVYAALEGHGLSVTGGRAGNIGVGGLALGGGLSYFLYDHGFVCDNIVAYEVVTAAGKVLTVTAHEHPDLFKALKGSGSPFAVITSFTIKTVPIDPSGNVWGGMMFSVGPPMTPIIDAVAAFDTTNVDTHLISAVGLIAGPNGTVNDLGINIVFHRTPSTEVPAIFEPIVAASTPGSLSNSIGVKKMSALADEVAGAGQELSRHEFYPFTLKSPNVALLKKLSEILHEVFTPVLPTIEGGAISLNFIPLGKDVGGKNNVLGLKGGVEYMSIHFFTSWTSADDDAAIHVALGEVYEKSIKAAKEAGAWVPYIYMNYANPDQDPIASYGKENVKFLRDVKQRYDPDGVWGRLVKGGFKIPGK